MAEKTTKTFCLLACIILCERKRVCISACEAIVRDARQTAPHFFLCRGRIAKLRAARKLRIVPKGIAQIAMTIKASKNPCWWKPFLAASAVIFYGALQDLGSRRAQNPGNLSDKIEPSFDSFSTELGWAADSFWSYFSVENDLPFPKTNSMDEEDADSAKLLKAIERGKIDWCACCGKKKASSGDCCTFPFPRMFSSILSGLAVRLDSIFSKLPIRFRHSFMFCCSVMLSNQAPLSSHHKTKETAEK